MISYPAREHPYSILYSNDEEQDTPPYPFFRDNVGDKVMWLVGPEHGRSFVVGQNKEGHFIVSKGNGLSYSSFNLLNTGESGSETWGLLLKEDATRDFILGQEIAKLGIKTNKMKYVLKLDYPIIPKYETLYPHLLQYSVECPYRISDAAFMTQSQIKQQVALWPQRYPFHYMDAAQVLISNLRTLHDNRIFHNAQTVQNYTWALELLDFELACSPAYPYTKKEYRRHVPDLMSREIIYVYQIINYIASVLGETINHYTLSGMFADMGFNLEQFYVKPETPK